MKFGMQFYVVFNRAFIVQSSATFKYSFQTYLFHFLFLGVVIQNFVTRTFDIMLLPSVSRKFVMSYHILIKVFNGKKSK